ncbi:MAG: HIT family protein [Pseudomonadota bacterium]
MKSSDDCIFCRIVAGTIPCVKVFEDDKVLAFMDVNPLNRGHLLVIPKEHWVTIDEVDPDLYAHVGSVLCRLAKAVRSAVNPEGMTVMQLNGRAGNQVVPHLHVHLVPRWENDGLPITAWDPVPGDPAERVEIAEAIKAAL